MYRNETLVAFFQLKILKYAEKVLIRLPNRLLTLLQNDPFSKKTSYSLIIKSKFRLLNRSFSILGTLYSTQLIILSGVLITEIKS